jgi:ribose 5-phosphate isomerase RpiB
MKIVVSSDVFGYALKETVKKHLTGKGHDVLDVGPRSEDDALYYVEATCRLCGRLRKGTANGGSCSAAPRRRRHRGQQA